MTQRLYFADAYTTVFEGRVVEQIATPEGPAVVLEGTYFYPESGGQPHDLGTIEGIPLVRVVEQGERILHVLTRFPESERVQCRIDAQRRRDHMQQHAGQHILSAAFIREGGAQTLSFHLGSSMSTIDVDRSPIEPDLIAAVEREANGVVRACLPVRSYFVKSEETSNLKLRKAPEVEGILRIVDIEGYDRQACCGTHTRTTAEVGPIFIRSLERWKNATRVEFVCGDRALTDYRASVERIRSLARVLSSPEHELVETATRLVQERKDQAKTLQALREEILEHRASAWLEQAEVLGGFRILVREVSEVTPAELRLLVIFVTKQPSCVALLGARAEGRAHLVFGCSGNAPPADMAVLLREVLPFVEGKGGGSPHMAQGGGPRVEGLSQALEHARQQILIRGR